MDRVDLTSTKGGVLVSIVDAPGVDNGDLEAHDFGPLDPRVSHTIKLWMQFNPGPNNDIVRVSIDGTDTGQCFASWENYYRANQPGNFQNTSDLQFRAALGGFDIPMAGYLFDNVSYTSSNGPAPPSCDLPIEKQADSPTVTAGGLAGTGSPSATVGDSPSVTSCSAITSRSTRHSQMPIASCVASVADAVSSSGASRPGGAPASTSGSASVQTRRRATWTTSPTSRQSHRRPRRPRLRLRPRTCRRAPPRYRPNRSRRSQPL